MYNMLPSIGHSIHSRFGIRDVVVREGGKSHLTRSLVELEDGRRPGIAQTENTVRDTKCGRIRGMVVGEGGRSTWFYCITKLATIDRVLLINAFGTTAMRKTALSTNTSVDLVVISRAWKAMIQHMETRRRIRV